MKNNNPDNNSVASELNSPIASNEDLAYLRESLCDSLQVLLDFVKKIDPAAYIKAVPSAFNSSVGGHLRHCLEHYEALRQAQEQGTVDYDARVRDTSLETQVASAQKRCEELLEWAKSLNVTDLDARVLVRCKTSREGDVSPSFASSLAREAMYSIHHAVHHQALIGTMCQLLGTPLPDSFGLAPSTAAHRRAQASA